MNSGFHRESSRTHYDVVVIGSGIGGLTAAALLARCGHSVLVIERHDRPGGYLHGFNRRGFQCDAGVHTVGGCAASGPEYQRVLGMLVEVLKLGDTVCFLPVDPIARICLPGLEISLPQGFERLHACLARRFPRQQRPLAEFLKLAANLADEACRVAAGIVTVHGLAK